MLLEIAELARSTYYVILSKDDKDIKNDSVMNKIIEIFYSHKTRYGYRRITLELVNQGFIINHKKVKRLMSKIGLYGKTPKIKYKSYTGDHNGVTKNLLLNKIIDKENNNTYFERSFKTTRCNQIWGTDVTQFSIKAGKLYLSPIIDFHNREIVAFNVSKSPNFEQITDMLTKGIGKFDHIDELIMHSDQGWQYQMKNYKAILAKKKIKQSMSRKGNCLDNSPTENFFGKLKNEMFYGEEHTFDSLKDLEGAIVNYIDYYNNHRITTKLKGMTPVQYRNHSSYAY